MNKENDSDNETSFLDIHMLINDNVLLSKLYDKRDDFNFKVHNFPNLSANIHYKRTHDVLISQLIRFSKVCMDKDDFIHRSKMMIYTLCNQFFNKSILKRKFSYFYDKYYHLVHKYNLSKLKMMKYVFE